MRHAARGVAAGRDFAPVDIEYPHRCERAGSGRRLDGKKLLAADTRMRIADADDIPGQEGAPVDAPVEDHEMVAQPVHLDEGAFGRRIVGGMMGKGVSRIHRAVV